MKKKKETNQCIHYTFSQISGFENYPCFRHMNTSFHAPIVSLNFSTLSKDLISSIQLTSLLALPFCQPIHNYEYILQSNLFSICPSHLNLFFHIDLCILDLIHIHPLILTLYMHYYKQVLNFYYVQFVVMYLLINSSEKSDISMLLCTTIFTSLDKHSLYI